MKTGISLGSNLGDRRQHLQDAKRFLAGLAPGLRASPLYETAPLDCPPGAPAFLNAAVELDWPGSPRDLLTQLRGYEDRQGRNRQLPQNSPRPIDLDILYMDDLEIAEPGLIIPHPRLAQRRFVLLPLAALCPERRLPGTTGTVCDLLAGLRGEAGAVKLLTIDW